MHSCLTAHTSTDKDVNACGDFTWTLLYVSAPLHFSHVFSFSCKPLRQELLAN